MRLSIVIPNYNYGDFVGAAIESALAVDWPDVEVIVVDDGSTDHSHEVIRGFGDRIKAIYQANRTQRVACNVGYTKTIGEIVCFLDSDDLLHPTVAREVAQVWHAGISKVQFQMMRMDRSGRPLGSVFPAYKPMPTPKKIRDWASSTSAYPTPPGSGNFYARSFLEKIFPLDDSCGAFSDSACVAVAPFLGDVVTIAKPLVFYRLHGHNDSSLLKDDANFAREISRAKARLAFSRRLCIENQDISDELIFQSLEVLQFRVASLKLRPDIHPLAGDSLRRVLVDAVRVPLWCPSASRKVRVLAAAWSILTILSPIDIARKLVRFRYR